MPIIVQKYGGTSVNTPEKREIVLKKIIRAKNQGNDVVVVLSAMGRKGEPYATDTFLDLLQQLGPDVEPRTKDLIASCGEVITSCIVAHALEQKGYKACVMTGFQAGIITDSSFNNAEITSVVPEKIIQAIKQDKIVVVAGFQGITEDGYITTLGRGGSDTTAIALGGALHAETTEIYTDVTGIAFADPRLIPEAPYFTCIDFSTMYILARAGAKVIHPRAVKAAIDHKAPFVVRSTFSEGTGTLIGKSGESFGGLYGMALTKGVSLIRIKGNDKLEQYRSIAVDELFYKATDGECTLAVQKNQDLSGFNNVNFEITPECDLVTVLWEEKEGINFDIIQNLLLLANIKPKEFFALESGGSWCISTKQSKDAMHSIFNSILSKFTSYKERTSEKKSAKLA